MAKENQLRRNEIGPVGLALAAKVEAMRNARGWNHPDLAEALAKVGRPILPMGLRRLEAGARRVDVDDLVGLALVFGMPVHELLRSGSDADESPYDELYAGEMARVAALPKKERDATYAEWAAEDARSALAIENGRLRADAERYRKIKALIEGDPA